VKMGTSRLLWRLLLLFACLFVFTFSLPTTTSDDDTQGSQLLTFNPEMIGHLMEANDASAHALKKKRDVTHAQVSKSLLVKKDDALKVSKRSATVKNKVKNVAKRSAKNEKKKADKLKKVTKRDAVETKQKKTKNSKKIIDQSQADDKKKKKKKKKRSVDAMKNKDKDKKNKRDVIPVKPQPALAVNPSLQEQTQNTELPFKMLFENFQNFENMISKRDLIPHELEGLHVESSFPQKRSEIPSDEFGEVAPYNAVWSELPEIVQKRSEISNNEVAKVEGEREGPIISAPTPFVLTKRETPSEMPINGNVFETMPGNTPLSYLAHLEETQRQQNTKRDEIARPEPEQQQGMKDEGLKKNEIMSPEEPQPSTNALKKDVVSSNMGTMKSSEDEYHEPPVKKGTILQPANNQQQQQQVDQVKQASLLGQQQKSAFLPSSSTTDILSASSESSRSMIPASSGLQSLSESNENTEGPEVTSQRSMIPLSAGLQSESSEDSPIIPDSPNLMVRQDSLTQQPTTSKKDTIERAPSSSPEAIRTLLKDTNNKDIVSVLSAMPLADLESIQKNGGMLSLEQPQSSVKTSETSKRTEIQTPEKFPTNVFPSLDDSDVVQPQAERRDEVQQGYPYNFQPYYNGIMASNYPMMTPRQPIDTAGVRKGNLEIEVSNEKSTMRDSGSLSGSNAISLPFPSLSDGSKKEVVNNVTQPEPSVPNAANLTSSLVETPLQNVTADSKPDTTVANLTDTKSDVANVTQATLTNATTEATPLINSTATNETTAGKKSEELPGTEDGLLQLTNNILTDLSGFEENVGNLKEASVSQHGDDTEFQVHLSKPNEKRNKIRQSDSKHKKENPGTSKNKLEDYLVSKFMSYVCGGEC